MRTDFLVGSHPAFYSFAFGAPAFKVSGHNPALHGLRIRCHRC
jgi:hypothetical protein